MKALQAGNSKLGRFQIQSLLGQGAQSKVYLCFDPQLEREVAIKTVHLQAGSKQREQLLAEARTVSRLRHPNIVPIFEAGEEGGDPYLVFEYVQGETLAQRLVGTGRVTESMAVDWMLQILAALGHAHASGVIHRDLKPSNILLDGREVARVMDFGIAARTGARAGQGEGELYGTPAFMAPEYISHNAMEPANDVFAAGLVLHELLTGRHPFPDPDPMRVIYRIAHEDIVLPAELRDGRLRKIMARALARDTEQRYRSAADMYAELKHFRDAVDEPFVPEGGEAAAVQFLLRRMRLKSDFPALGDAISAVNRLAASDTENIAALSGQILKDFSLTNKLLRVVNTAHYRPYGGGQISTISRAVAVLGFDAVRSIAMSLILFEHVGDKANARELQEAFLEVNLAGMLARGLAAATVPRAGEEAFICTLFFRLGELLARYYLPEEAREIVRLVQRDRTDAERAAKKVLGVGFEDLGIAVARSWGFPDIIMQSMQRLPQGPVREPATHTQRLRVLASCAHELVDAVLQGDAAIREVCERYERAVGVSAARLTETIDQAKKQLADFAVILGIRLADSGLGRRLGAAVSQSGPTGETLPGALPDRAPEMLAQSDGTSGPDRPVDAAGALTAGIQDVTNALVEGMSLNDMFRIVLETLYRALAFRRVLLCVRDPRKRMMIGRLGFGDGADTVIPGFRFALDGVDLFNLVLKKGADLLVTNAHEEPVVRRVPDWYKRAVDAETFVLLPLVHKNNPVALIYADRERAGEIVIAEKELALVRTLRNQALLAIRQASA
ncbi:MAG: hypothetical protein AMXMBFR6_24660 [Betaproteobacteria bacterium]